MTDAYNSGHQVGETTDNVGQDVNGETQENSTNWEEQAKYFQGEKDKLFEENKRLKGYEEIGKFLESRPEVVQMIDAASRGGQPQAQQPPKLELSPDEFDPWEAYNDPSSKSYQFRQQELQGAISNAVDKAVGESTAEQNAKQGMVNLTNELRNRGFNDEQIKGFMDFTSKNPADYGLDTVIQMYNAVEGGDANVIPSSGLDGVRNTQNQPTPGGILDGQKPQMKNEDEEMFKRVIGAGGVGNRLP
tara:strand:+ start:339 stop:1076 length:738 start_codon:yes stop_codon:yes gene_type:complete